MAITNADYGTIRQFDGRDLDRILEIASASLSEYYSEALIMDLYDEWPQAFLVYTMGREIQGFIIGSRFSPTEARVLILAVDQQFRNMGIAWSPHAVLPCVVQQEQLHERKTGS
ncbi:MAG: hypothetical protein AMDU1_APLC00032G0047 [Thermoplasmatales archaeon A-plasma]|nr:MAG: hypothetical protein AMDU1_APLC00032G0047 [Thermoplasmatales archaeon A-plasma]